MHDDAMQPLLNLLGPAPQPQRLSLAQWDLVVRQARRANVLARIASLVQARCAWHAVAPAPRQHPCTATSTPPARSHCHDFCDLNLHP